MLILTMSLQSTNDAFLSCCKEKNVDAKCESRCNFDILDRRVVNIDLFYDVSFSFLFPLILFLFVNT